MNREQFMKELAYLLQDVPDEERKEAIQYYNDYFDDAGPENEAALIEELESPEKVAAIIKDGLLGGSKEQGEFSEKGFEDERFERKQELTKRPDYVQRSGEEESGYRYYTGTGGYTYERGSYGKGAAGTGNETSRPRRNSGLRITLMILLCLFAIPIGVPVLVAVAATLFALLVAAAAVVFSLFVVCVAFLIAGVVLIGVGIVKMFTFAAAGLLLSGIGFVMFALGILGCLGMGALIVKGIPACCRGISFVWRRLFGRRRRGCAA